MVDIYREIVRLEESGAAAALAVVTSVKGHTPQVMGAKMLVRADGTCVGTIGGGRIEHEVQARAADVIASGEAVHETWRLKAELAMCCGGEMSVFIECIQARERVVLFGAGHVAQATARVAALAGFRVTVVDPRDDWATLDRFPEGADVQVVAHDAYLASAQFSPRDFVVITTHNHDHDREILGGLLPLDAGYVGMIGSSRKAQKMLNELRAEGHPEEALRRVHSPIGLDILAETPDEIAVAIVGELIRHRHQGRSRKSTRGTAVASLSVTAEEA